MCGAQNPPTNAVLGAGWRQSRQTAPKTAFVFVAKERRHRAKHETGWLDNAAIMRNSLRPSQNPFALRFFAREAGKKEQRKSWVLEWQP